MSSGNDARRWRLSYISAGSPPGRSVRPQPSRKSVSPATRRPSTRKHWLPRVRPGAGGRGERGGAEAVEEERVTRDEAPVDREALASRRVPGRVDQGDRDLADLDGVAA